jgi:hypothetical protein
MREDLVTRDKARKPKSIEALNQRVSLLITHASDHVCCRDKNDKIMATRKGKSLRSVWVPKTYLTNPQDPITFGYQKQEFGLFCRNTPPVVLVRCWTLDALII